MGTLRSREDNKFFQGIAEEQFNLFGNDDFYLHVLDKQQSVGAQDPLYGEPVSHMGYYYTSYRVKGFVEEVVSDDIASEFGDDLEDSNVGYLNRTNLVNVGVLPHGFESDKDLIVTGDVLEVYRGGVGHRYYDIVSVANTGYLNDTDEFSIIRMDLKRRAKFDPARKVEDNC